MKKVSKKLNINKETISTLSTKEMTAIVGGLREHDTKYTVEACLSKPCVSNYCTIA